MNYIKIFVLTLIVWFAQRSIASKIPSDFTSISSLLQSRIKRDNDYEVKCHQSGTGMYYFNLLLLIMIKRYWAKSFSTFSLSIYWALVR